VNVTGHWAQLACIWEATARKAGNVHRFRDAVDMSYVDFLTAAAAVGPVLDEARELGIGRTVLEAVRATRQVVRVNVNLGIVLLLAPLAAVSPDVELRSGVEAVLAQLDLNEARLVFEAIRLAEPGGLGEVDQQDVRHEPTLPLRAVMKLAAQRDRIACQYATGFRDVFDVGVPALCRGMEQLGGLEEATIQCQLELLAQFPDSLIARKLGSEAAAEVSQHAAKVLAAGWPRSDDSRRHFRELDARLRLDGSRRNPGTTADLVAASLFVALREGILKVPLEIPWSAGLVS
jgi:triphosphoribosyl-dephospho-CoA synthase